MCRRSGLVGDRRRLGRRPAGVLAGIPGGVCVGIILVGLAERDGWIAHEAGIGKACGDLRVVGVGGLVLTQAFKARARLVACQHRCDRVLRVADLEEGCPGIDRGRDKEQAHAASTMLRARRPLGQMAATKKMAMGASTASSQRQGYCRKGISGSRCQSGRETGSRKKKMTMGMAARGIFLVLEKSYGNSRR